MRCAVSTSAKRTCQPSPSAEAAGGADGAAPAAERAAIRSVAACDLNSGRVNVVPHFVSGLGSMKPRIVATSLLIGRDKAAQRPYRGAVGVELGAHAVDVAGPAEVWKAFVEAGDDLVR